MFSKVHLHQQQQQQHPFPFSRESQTSEEDDSRSSGGPSTPAAQRPISAGEEGTIEVLKRPRGRPPGSKNKPKPPLIVTREHEPAMSPYILEVPGGSDVVEAIARFTHRKNTGLCVLTGSGTVSNVTLRQPSTAGATITFHGRFDILSLSATLLSHAPGDSPAIPTVFTVSLAGPQGQIVGGLVAGKLLAAGTVFVVAAKFNNPSYHKLSSEEDLRNSSVSGEGSSPAESAGGEGVSGEACGVGMYSCHLPSDVIWAPTPRPPPF